MTSKTLERRLLASAETLLDVRPRSAAYRRRAVSSAYYAVFHALMQLCVDALLRDGDLDLPERQRVYRSLDHKSVKTVFDQPRLKNHPESRRLGGVIATSQNERLDADYLPPDRDLFPVQRVRELIDQAKQVMDDLDNLSAEDCRILAICLLFKARSN